MLLLHSCKPVHSGVLCLSGALNSLSGHLLHSIINNKNHVVYLPSFPPSPCPSPSHLGLTTLTQMKFNSLPTCSPPVLLKALRTTGSVILLLGLTVHSGFLTPGESPEVSRGLTALLQVNYS